MITLLLLSLIHSGESQALSVTPTNSAVFAVTEYEYQVTGISR